MKQEVVVLAVFAAALVAQADKSVSQCPSLLQVGAVRKKVPAELPELPKSLESLLTVHNSTTPAAPNSTAKRDNDKSKTKPWIRWKWGMKDHQLLLEVGTLVALVLLSGAGIYFWLDKKLGIDIFSFLKHKETLLFEYSKEDDTKRPMFFRLEDEFGKEAGGITQENWTTMINVKDKDGKVILSQDVEQNNIASEQWPISVYKVPIQTSSENTPQRLRLVAWGENVQNDVCDYVMVFSATRQIDPKTPMRRPRTVAHVEIPEMSFSLGNTMLGINDPLRIVDGFDMAKKVFLADHRHHFVTESELHERFENAFTFEAYQKAVRKFLYDMLTSRTGAHQFGFTIEEFTNADRDRVFWRMELDDVAVQQYAAHYRYPVSLNDAAYVKADVKVPVNWNGEKVHAFWPYMPKFSGMYKEFAQTDRLKLMLMRIDRYVNLNALVEQTVLLQHFAVHDLEQIGFFVRTWGAIRHWYRFTMYERIDEVKTYFGEQVAFMFLWQRFYLGALIVPAVGGGLVFLRRFFIPERAHSVVEMVFTVVMSVWATIFNARYARFEERTRQRWGSSEFRMHSLDIKHEYDPKKQDSWRVFLVYGIGDLLAFLAMILSILSTFAIQHMRSQHRDFFGKEHRWYVEKGAGMATAVQILMFDWAWQLVSYIIVNNENHRLRSNWWDAWIKRMLTVRVFTNLYPFVYVGFLKEYTAEGCPRTGHGCLDELQANLIIFFVLAAMCNLGRDIGFIAYARMQHAMTKSSLNNDHMSLQVQSTLYDYNEWVFIDDWTRQVTTFLVLTCFNVVLPVIGVFVLLATMFEARMLAHRICCHLQRPFPYEAVGIGSWQGILEVMTLLGVLVTSSFAIFVMHPLRQRALWEKVVLFVVAEHMLLFLNLFVRAKFPKVPADVHEVSEENEKMLMTHFIDPNAHIIDLQPSGTGSLLTSVGLRFKRVVNQAVFVNQAQTRSQQGGTLESSTATSSRSPFPPTDEHTLPNTT